MGAAICNPEGELIALGCNDVPRAKGGLYWEGDKNDARDHVLGYDSNDRMKRSLVRDILERLGKSGWLNEAQTGDVNEALVSAALAADGPLVGADLTNITEYGRAVHAEMSAIIDAARRGVSVRGCTLYTTTFPCHNCAKHLVAAGIAKVIYVEPYPKSFSAFLHEDAISLDGSLQEDRVPFEPFVGVAPRQYSRLFTMGDVKRKKAGDIVKWQPTSALPRESERANTYLVLENESILRLHEKLQSAKIKAVNLDAIRT